MKEIYNYFEAVSAMANILGHPIKPTFFSTYVELRSPEYMTMTLKIMPNKLKFTIPIDLKEHYMLSKQYQRMIDDKEYRGAKVGGWSSVEYEFYFKDLEEFKEFFEKNFID